MGTREYPGGLLHKLNKMLKLWEKLKLVSWSPLESYTGDSRGAPPQPVLPERSIPTQATTAK